MGNLIKFKIKAPTIKIYTAQIGGSMNGRTGPIVSAEDWDKLGDANDYKSKYCQTGNAFTNGYIVFLHRPAKGATVADINPNIGRYIGIYKDGVIYEPSAETFRTLNLNSSELHSHKLHQNGLVYIKLQERDTVYYVNQAADYAMEKEVEISRSTMSPRHTDTKCQCTRNLI